MKRTKLTASTLAAGAAAFVLGTAGAASGAGTAADPVAVCYDADGVRVFTQEQAVSCYVVWPQNECEERLARTGDPSIGDSWYLCTHPGELG